MKKTPLILSVIALVLSSIAIWKGLSKEEQVYVDVNKLVEGYERTKIVRTDFQEKAKTLNANIDSLISGWQNELKSYEKERASMTKKEKELKQQLLSGKQQQITNYQQTIQKQIKEEDQKATQTVINDINDYVKAYGKEKGYKIILGASGAGNIMYADEGTDLTTKVLEGLNAEFRGK
ncbi:OmpH family outer membrane protein [Kordia sp.]|uniref:OmpH family outer membrane protein n=1 Tax=Kordia sp. TaxID=1965332 RepID=UPI003B59F134